MGCSTGGQSRLAGICVGMASVGDMARLMGRIEWDCVAMDAAGAGIGDEVGTGGLGCFILEIGREMSGSKERGW